MKQFQTNIVVCLNAILCVTFALRTIQVYVANNWMLFFHIDLDPHLLAHRFQARLCVCHFNMAIGMRHYIYIYICIASLLMFTILLLPRLPGLSVPSIIQLKDVRTNVCAMVPQYRGIFPMILFFEESGRRVQITRNSVSEISITSEHVPCLPDCMLTQRRLLSMRILTVVILYSIRWLL